MFINFCVISNDVHSIMRRRDIGRIFCVRDKLIGPRIRSLTNMSYDDDVVLCCCCADAGTIGTVSESIGTSENSLQGNIS